MVVVSLFNGMNTGRQALEDAGIKVDKYYSSELKSFAIKLTQHHFPDTIQLGNILNWREWNIDWSKVDLILSGSPCKDLSIAGSRAGIYGENSGLFWVFIDILEHCKKLNPNVLFFQENVGSAPKKDIGVMSRAMGVYPQRINSKLVVAQNRDRYYWSNMSMSMDGLFGDLVTSFILPLDKNIILDDVIEHGLLDSDKAKTLLMSEAKTFGYKDLQKFHDFIVKRIKQGRQIPNIVYELRNNKKACALLESESRAETGESLLKRNRKGLRNAVYGIAKRGRGEKGSIKQKIEINDSGKANCITTVDKDSMVLDRFVIRPLTKVELLRVQGFPDNYCDILSRNQTASLVGDGWTLPLITHFFKQLPKNYFK